ncbi:MAG: POTRA domain-containing protein [Roseivirga sp.]
MKHSFYPTLLLSLIWSLLMPLRAAWGQVTPKSQSLDLNYAVPASYLIEDIQVTGIQSLDQEIILTIAGIQAGDTVQIPGPALQDAIQRIWKQKLVKEVALYATKVAEQRIVLTIDITECPRLSAYSFEGIKRKEQEKLLEKTTLVKGKIVTDELIQETQQAIQDYWTEEGYLNATVTVTSVPDPEHAHQVHLKVGINKGERLIINEVHFEGNHSISSEVLRSQMQHTREKARFTLVKDALKRIMTLKPIRKGGILWRSPDFEETNNYLQEHVILFSSKFNPDKFEEDKKSLISYYQSRGFRDATLLEDTVYQPDKGLLNVKIKIQEGKQYCIGNIRWVGNHRYDEDTLNSTLGLQKGDLYNLTLLQQRLLNNPEGPDVASLYADDGHLFFHAEAVEVGLEEDRVDLEIRLQEGPQARIKEVLIECNTITHDYVIRRELRTLPGEKYSRTKVQRSYRELALLNIFAPAIDITPIPNPEDGTVDLKYKVKESPKFEVKASLGFGGGKQDAIGAITLNVNNFAAGSLGKIFKGRLPIGAGQTFVLKAESNWGAYKNFLLQFSEPWLGGKRPQELYLSTNLSHEDNRYSVGGRVGLGTRLIGLDDYMTLRYGLAYYGHTYTHYDLIGNGKKFPKGTLRELTANISLERNSIDSPIYPREGSKVGLHVTLTPPWSSLSSQDSSKMVGADRYPWKEYHQWMLDGSYFFSIVGDLVLNVRGHTGFLGSFSSQKPIGPFQRFYMGGKGLADRALRGKEQISLRGYDDESIVPKSKTTGYKGGVIFNKFVLELRYPILSSQMASIYALGFAEAGNTWAHYEDWNLKTLKHSAGVGLRAFLPLIGSLGFDWGYGFDEDLKSGQSKEIKFHWSAGMDVGR